MDINVWRREPILVFLIFTAVFAYIYPDLFFLRLSPMGGDPVTLKDPTVSWSAFIPAFREFRYELLEHGNLLWSNLRGLGQPILGNTIQGAPLFPLNLVLLPLPDQFYWSVMPISRVILISLAAFLIGRKVVGLSFVASLFFALLIGFNTNTLRWMNHPWSNGFLAGLWYFYFLCRICLVTDRRNQSWCSIGLVVSVFAMITCGFPEATIMSAIIVAILFVGFAFTYWSELKPRLADIVVLLITCHLIGFALSSVQLFALLEFIQQGRAMDLRSNYGGGGYTSDKLVPYSLAQLSVFGVSKEQQTLLTFSMGLWGLFFAIRGLVSVVSGSAKRSNGQRYTSFAIAFLACMVLFIAKAFSLSELLTTIFVSTPLLAQSHFPLYFSPLFFIGFAFFASIGLSGLLAENAESGPAKWPSIVSSIVAIAVVVGLSAMAIEHFYKLSFSQLVQTLFAKPEYFSLTLFIIGGVVIIALQLFTNNKRFEWLARNKIITVSLAIALLALTVTEKDQTLPKTFSRFGHPLLGPNEETKNAIYQAYDASPVAIHELRGTNINGDFIGQGLATVDNGASAILPPQNRLLRLSLFNVPFGGYLPLKRPLRNWSYQAISANIISVHSTPKSHPTWESYQPEPEIDSQLTSWPYETQVLKNPFYMEARSIAHVQQHRGVSIWLHFQATDVDNQREKESADFWIEVNIGSQNKTTKRGTRDVVDTKWRIRVPADWLRYDSYRVTLRQVDPATLGYHDAPPVALNVNRLHPDAIADTRLQLLSSSEDNKRHFFFDKDALPRAYLASSCRQANTLEEEMAFYRQDDSVMKGTLVFPFNAPNTLVSCDSYQDEFKPVSIQEDHRTGLKFESIQGPALLYLNDSDYPGWKAYDSLSDTELTIQRANSNGRSVYLPESRLYHISMKYTPIWLAWVYVLLGVAVALIAVLYRVIWRRGNV